MPMKMLLMLLMLIPIISACGDADPAVGKQNAIDQTSANDAMVDDIGAAMGAGEGGGTLVFNGTTYPIESALCYLEEPMDVGTVGQGFRILVSGSADRPYVSIIDAGSLMWTPSQFPRNPIEVSGSRLSYSVETYRNNRDDETVEASFEIECP